MMLPPAAMYCVDMSHKDVPPRIDAIAHSVAFCFVRSPFQYMSFTFDGERVDREGRAVLDTGYDHRTAEWRHVFCLKPDGGIYAMSELTPEEHDQAELAEWLVDYLGIADSPGQWTVILTWSDG